MTTVIDVDGVLVYHRRKADGDYYRRWGTVPGCPIWIPPTKDQEDAEIQVLRDVSGELADAVESAYEVGGAVGRRALRGAKILIKGDVKKLSNTQFFVEAQTNPGRRYYVRKSKRAWVCDCDDFRGEGWSEAPVIQGHKFCKHIHAVGFYRRFGGLPEEWGAIVEGWEPAA